MRTFAARCWCAAGTRFTLIHGCWNWRLTKRKALHQTRAGRLALAVPESETLLERAFTQGRSAPLPALAISAVIRKPRRWMSAPTRQILEHLAQAETAERAHPGLERRLRLSEIKKFKPMADFDWSWPTMPEGRQVAHLLQRELTMY